MERFILNDGQFGSSFEAFDESTLFTGIVLTDGYACSWGLPADIRQQKRFVSLFGHFKFEVFSTNGVFRTERKYCDRLYGFALEDEELFIQELCAEPSEKSRGRYASEQQFDDSCHNFLATWCSCCRTELILVDPKFACLFQLVPRRNRLKE
ncbi:hypothetical protein PsorP6_018458 [Peronosclerospora sorghi]|nr:hypothetical protein PsorP6_018458 [Peronosclerospora sorghi]